jgi:hypothetical protein
MNPILQFVATASLASLLFPAIAVGADEVSLSEYQDILIGYAVFAGAEGSAAQLEALTDEEWQQLYDLTPSPERLAKAINRLQIAARDSVTDDQLVVSQAIDPNVTVMGEFEPDYPNTDRSSEECITSPDTCYAFYIQPAALLQFFAPDSGEAGIHDNRCDEEAEADARTTHIDLHVLAIGAQFLCDTAFVLCAGAGAAWGLDFAAEEFVVACEAQTGNVDGAEIEAAYENTRTILDQANGMTSILSNETNFTDDAELASHESTILGTLTSQHDALNAQLISIKTQLARQQTQLRRITKLLNTPPGRRPKWNKWPADDRRRPR